MNHDILHRVNAAIDNVLACERLKRMRRTVCTQRSLAVRAEADVGHGLRDLLRRGGAALDDSFAHKRHERGRRAAREQLGLAVSAVARYCVIQ